MWFRVICLSVICLAAPRESTTFWPLWWRVPVADKSTDNAKPHSICFFTTVATNLAIWLANLPLSIRVQTGLHTSMCHVMPFSARARPRALKINTFFDLDIVVNLILPQYQRQRKCFFSEHVVERELKMALRDTLTCAALSVLLLTTAN